jgi:hypothetical protein
VSAAGITRFQAAFISPTDIQLLVARLANGQRGWNMSEEESTLLAERPPRLRAPLDWLKQHVQAS